MINSHFVALNEFSPSIAVILLKGVLLIDFTVGISRYYMKYLTAKAKLLRTFESNKNVTND